MANAPSKQGDHPPTKSVERLLYHCRCYAVGDEYEMWVLDPKTATYNGPIPCTAEQCRNCNMSKAEAVPGG
jgi:hypothetical protein